MLASATRHSARLVKAAVTPLARTMASASQYDTLTVSQVADYVAHVQLNRPERANALNKQMWAEIRAVFEELSDDPDTRAVVVSGSGKGFTGGLDLQDHMDWFMQSEEHPDPSRIAFKMMKTIKYYQDSMSALEHCTKPVIAAVHGACVGAGVDMICAADIRYAASNAYFCVKEVEIGLAADVGTLQRLPKVIGNESLARELAFTARNMGADEAARVGLVSAVLNSPEETLATAVSTASRIAAMSPVAIQGTKAALNHSREHGIEQGLKFQVAWNGAMLQTHDIPAAAQAMMSKQKAEFAKL